jgi:TolB-like protein
LIYNFENYSLDVDRQELRRGSDLVDVEPQVLDLLQYLIRNRERVVSKDDLIANVWNGRIVSDSTLTSRITTVRQVVGDSGDDQRLIRTIARKGIRFVGEIQENQSASGANAPSQASQTEVDVTRPVSAGRVVPGLPDKPSIAVLPFINMSGDPEQEYFADGMVEDIITALSRFRQLFVIARNSSFTYKGRAADVKQVGRELGVRYVLEGSVRKSGSRVRITGQLIDTATGAHLWADHFDGALEDIFDLQDQVTASVVGAIAPKLEQAEIERAKRKPTERLDAYDYYLRGMENLHQRTRPATEQALQLFYRAVELDPQFASAYGMAARCYIIRGSQGWVTNHAEDVVEGARLAQQALELGKEDAVALSSGSFARAFFVHDFDAGALFSNRACQLNPNLASAWWFSGWIRLWRGEHDLAIKHFAHFKRMSPLDPFMSGMHSGTAFAQVFAGHYDEAAANADQALSESPNLHQALRAAAVSYALAGRIEQAQKVMFRLREIDPSLRISNLKNFTPLRRPEDMERYAEGMRKAGLPE